MAKPNKLKKEVISWVVFLSILGILYFSGLYVHVASSLQRVIIATGLITPDLDTTIDDQVNASFDFQLLSEQGEVIDVKQLKGKVIFMNFWATWCPPCIAEMPDINELYKKVNTKDIVFLMISSDKDFKIAQAFKQKKEFSFPIFTLAGNIPKVYHTGSIPSTFVISKEGKIATKKVGFASYDTESFRNFLVDLSSN